MIAAALYVLLMGIDFDPSFSTLSVLTRLRDEYGPEKGRDR